MKSKLEESQITILSKPEQQPVSFSLLSAIRVIALTKRFLAEVDIREGLRKPWSIFNVFLQFRNSCDLTIQEDRMSFVIKKIHTPFSTGSNYSGKVQLGSISSDIDILLMLQDLYLCFLEPFRPK